ncbi:dynamin family protein [uncultured Tolumonas sp.]|uniref:dynamin family protein n=1 Tax=uncultured Tolumonas sp. TaxID=263765 RepID=UPI002A0A9AC1|nr:dynamin family protein [uncultured Tolumonas sp.]
MNKDKLNQEMSVLLIELREKSGLSQQEIADRSNVYGIGTLLDQRSVSRIEKSPLSADSTKLAAFLIAVGSKPEFYYETLKTKTSEAKLRKFKISYRESNMESSKLLETSLVKLNEITCILRNNPMEGVDTNRLLDEIYNADTALRCLNGKTTLGVFGLFDAGKSTLLNTLVGQELLPEKYQPATNVVNMLMHSSDKPETLNHNVAVFKKGFRPYMIHDKKLVEEHLLAEGDASILTRFGVHNYDSIDPISKQAYISISFVNADILKNVWLLDTPGDLNSTDEDDTEKALTGSELVDGVIYVSSFNGYMDGGDIGFLSNIIRNKPPVAPTHPTNHLMFVLSHCHDGIKESQYKQIKEDTFKRCSKQLNALIFEKWLSDGCIDTLPTNSALSDRVRPFYRENTDYVQGLIKSVTDMANELISHREAIISQRITAIETSIIAKLNTEISKITFFKTGTEKRIEEVNQMDARFRQRSGELVDRFKKLIGNCGDRVKADQEIISNYYDSLMQKSVLSELISETYTDKKEAGEGVGNYITQLLTGRLEKVLMSSSKDISNETELLLREWQEIVPNHTTLDASDQSTNVHCDFALNAFNARAAFIGGLSGLGSLGAMSLYVSTIASNLGAYLLVGKAAGVLTTLGITSSVTSITSLVAALGGPITIGIAIAVAIGYIVYRITGGSWQDALAKKVIEAFENEDVVIKLHSEIEKFWNSTETAMTKGLKELTVETDNFIEKMKEDAKTEFDPIVLDTSIEFMNTAKRILA